MKYDLIIVSFSHLSSDARTLNFARTASQLGQKTAIISLHEKAITKIKGTDLFHISINEKQRMLFKWYSFVRKAGKLIQNLQTKNVLAADLYSLPVISKVFAKRYIYDSREIYSALGPLAGQKLKQKIITEIEKYYSSILNVIYTSGEIDTEYLRKNLTDKPEYYEIYNVPPYKEPVKSDLLREKFNIPTDKKILLYQGAVLPHRGILPVIEFIKKSDKHVLCIIGDGELLEKIKNIISDNNLKEKIFIAGKINYDELHEWTCSADIGLALFEPVTLSYELAFPNKLFEYIMAGIPVLATDLETIRRVYEKFNFGSLISKDMTNNQIETGIKLIEDNIEFIKNENKKASKEYCYENQIKKIKNLII